MIKPVLVSIVSDYTLDSSSGKVLACSSVWLVGEGMEGMGGKPCRPQPFLGSTYQSIYLFTYQPTYLLTYQPTYLLTYLPTNLLAHTFLLCGMREWDKLKNHFQAAFLFTGVGMFA